MTKKNVIILITLLIILFTINYNFVDDFLVNFLEDGEITIVERVIDGDTIVVTNDTHIRLLGINTPERGEVLYEEAKVYLEDRVLNQSIYLEYGREKYDKYHRVLAYVFLGEENINLELVEKGFANYYFPSGIDGYYLDLKEAWDRCIESNLNLCEVSESSCSGCLELSENLIKNSCDFDCDLNNWIIKSEGRKKFIFSDNLENNQEISFDLELSGNTLFLRDSENKLVLWQSY